MNGQLHYSEDCHRMLEKKEGGGGRGGGREEREKETLLNADFSNCSSFELLDIIVCPRDAKRGPRENHFQIKCFIRTYVIMFISRSPDSMSESYTANCF